MEDSIRNNIAIFNFAALNALEDSIRNNIAIFNFAAFFFLLLSLFVGFFCFSILSQSVEDF